jgi:uncharacterized protein (DUF1499 family)
MLTKVLIAVIAVPFLLFIGWQVFITLRIGAVEDANRALVDFESLNLSPRPNQWLLRPGQAAASAMEAPSPIFPVAPERLRDALLAVVEASPRTRILERRADGLAFTAMQLTALMRYPDFISMEIRPVDGGGSMLLVYSRSVFGHSDLGVNKARMDGWLAQVQARLS